MLTPKPYVIVGIDLSGPANAADTALVWFAQRQGRLDYLGSAIGASDADIVRIVTNLEHPVVGLDAPLSYNDGGGDRPGDADLRRVIVATGMRSGSVMTPTLTRMAYLTLRGMAVARALEAESVSRRSLVEVHPGAAFALRGAPLEAVLDYKRVASSRNRLLRWLSPAGVHGVPMQ